MIKPRYYAQRGHIHTVGLLFDARQLSPENQAKRVLQNWEPGSRLYRFQHGYFLLWPSARTIQATCAPSIPLSDIDGIYTSVALSADDIDRLDLAPGYLVYVRHDRYEIQRPNQLETIDPATWLDISTYQLLEVETLGLPPSSPKVQVSHRGKSVHELIDKPELAPGEKQKKTIAGLRKAGNYGLSGRERHSGGWLSAVVQAFGHYWKLAESRKASGGDSAIRNPATGTQQGLSPVEDQASGFSLRGIIARFVMMSKLGNIIGRMQSRYLQDMMNLFEKGDLENALKHAIPLSDVRDALQPSPPSISVRPQIRASLRIQNQRSSSSSSIHLEESLLAHMRKLYEQSFATLDRAGKVQEAAFVLAELLKDIDRAVEYLERNGLLQMAAELAEGQKLHPSRVIRQWLLAGNLERALMFARVAACYEPAIAALERTHPKQAMQLRWELAQVLAKAGDYNRAADIAWPLPEKRDTIIDWLRKGASQGGASGARQLVRLISIVPPDISPLFEKLSHILNEQDSASASIRLAVVKALFDTRPSASLAGCAKAAARAYLKDVSAGWITYDAKMFRRLVDICGDGAFSADVRNLSLDNKSTKNVSAIGHNRPVEFEFSGCGQLPVHDASLLVNGCFLLGLGESGTEIRRRDGKPLHRFNIPCHKIVMSDRRNQALLIAPRGGYLVIHRFDLDGPTVERWIELRANAWADSYDGITWLVGNDNQLWALDAQAEESQSVWSVSDLPGEVKVIERSPQQFSTALVTEQGIEIWRYELPNLYLRERNPADHTALQALSPVAIDHNGMMVGIDTENSRRIALFKNEKDVHWHDLEAVEAIDHLRLQGSFLIANTYTDEGTHGLYVFKVRSLQQSEPLLVVTLENSPSISVKVEEEQLLIFHRGGRLILLDLLHRKIIADLTL